MARRTLVAIKCRGHDQRLCSIDQSRDGSLILRFDFAATTMAGEVLETKEFKQTAHTAVDHSPLTSRGFKMKYQVSHPEKGVFDRSGVVDASGSLPLCWPLLIGLWGVKDNPVYDLKPKKSDTVEELVGWHAIDDSLAVAIFVTEPETIMPEVSGFSKVEMSFDKLKLTWYTCFFHFPMVGHNWMGPIVDLPLRANGALVEPQADLQHSVPVSHVGPVICDHLLKVGQITANMIDIERQKIGLPAAPIIVAPVHFARFPHEDEDEEHRMYGRASRRSQNFQDKYAVIHRPFRP